MGEREQRWAELEAEIICPKTGKPCEQPKELNRNELFLSRSAVIFTVECKSYGAKASGWGEQP